MSIIDKISTCSKMAYFHGPWFVTPSETPHHPTQLFYKQEAFISTIQDSNPLLSVVGKCCVLEVDDYRYDYRKSSIFKNLLSF